MIPETQVTCFRFRRIMFVQNIFLKTVKSNYTSVRFVVFGYLLLVFVPLWFQQISIYLYTKLSILKIFLLHVLHAKLMFWVFYTQVISSTSFLDWETYTLIKSLVVHNHEYRMKWDIVMNIQTCILQAGRNLVVKTSVYSFNTIYVIEL